MTWPPTTDGTACEVKLRPTTRIVVAIGGLSCYEFGANDGAAARPLFHDDVLSKPPLHALCHDARCNVECPPRRAWQNDAHRSGGGNECACATSACHLRGALTRESREEALPKRIQVPGVYCRIIPCFSMNSTI